MSLFQKSLCDFLHPMAHKEEECPMAQSSNLEEDSPKIDLAPLFEKTPILRRSTSRLRIRDHINTFLGYEVEKARCKFAPPCVREFIMSHEESMLFKFLHFQSCEVDRPLLYKWGFWLEMGTRPMLEDIVETQLQVKLGLKKLRNQEFGKAHFMRFGLKPSGKHHLLENGDKVACKVDSDCALDFFQALTQIALSDKLYRPLEVQRKFRLASFRRILTTVPVLGLTLHRVKEYALVFLWLSGDESPAKIFGLLSKMAEILPPDLERFIYTAVVISNKTGDSTQVYDLLT